MEKFDTIIIGSGAGGLSAAICLARAGQKVVVLEQHDVPGGWCHSFMLNGFRFSPGVHYIGLMEPGQSTNDLYRGLEVANELVFFRMNKAAYEHCLIQNERIDLPAGIGNLENVLSDRFPAEKKRIKRYLSLVRKVSRQIQLIPKMSGFWDNLTIPFRTRDMGRYGLFSLKRVSNWYIKDPLLRSILSIQCGDHGLPPVKASFPVHCAVMDHYFDGGYYPMGGGGGLVKAMTNVLKKYGGEIRTRRDVTKILIEKGTAIGVELKDGNQLHASSILSNADPGTTYRDLVGAEHLSSSFIRKLAKTKYSVTSVMLFLTVDMDVRKAGMDSGNFWIVTENDLDQVFEKMISRNISDEDEFPAVFISCTTLKDPTHFNGKHHNLEVVTFVDYDSFNQFNEPGDYHSQAYTQFKSRLTDKLPTTLEKVLPGVKEHVIHADLGTPKTNQFYVRSTNGCVYGTEKSLSQIGPFSFSSSAPIRNLYLCGASTLSHGVAGATYSGVKTAAIILKCNEQELIEPRKDQFLRIYDAEDNTTWPAWVFQKREERKRRVTVNV